jgi:hypothetical protein
MHVLAGTQENFQMYMTEVFAEGGYRFIPAMFQYSGGVAAEPGYRIERVRLMNPVPLIESGFPTIERHLRTIGQPLAAFCACELRSPKPVSDDGFKAFNRTYASQLQAWGIMRGDINPVARTNVCPEIDAPQQVLLYAFSYTVPDEDAKPSFIGAGSGEAPEVGPGTYRDRAIRLGDRTPEGLRIKAEWVMDEMTRRVQGLGFDWSDITGSHVYTVYDFHPFVQDVLVSRGAARKGLTWHFSRPPVADLDYEMDVRAIFHERIL